ncbi:barstar family protein [Taylorella equigenitalis]|uniref:Barstar (barnase inhibitor) domain-containing protein n=2 Tax=Taylorella equigenitalis TaxID=29575 RepID=A0A654KI11_TAYEM|nr:barstar family protein [Taylorella equigenitalis]ADU92073.1 hypothetical protein TEQUI_1149 [Taylorella equigenitalis MCE9]AFN35634.1 putative barstar [Taylorella equigenitalis ATCC 35865]ASY30286.1 barnase inhibitor [Taylorella equigenitalis]ASY37589.1 barnase inhibitor [Taylorella equigenitalis]ASY39058.1 barnase inhibitor [Taylorella equigenitalis]
MQIKKCDLTGIKSTEEAYTRFTDAFKLPSCVGRNLDALYDVLSTEVEGPLEIIWSDLDGSATSMSWDTINSMLEVFRCVENDRDDLNLRISE